MALFPFPFHPQSVYKFCNQLLSLYHRLNTCLKCKPCRCLRPILSPDKSLNFKFENTGICMPFGFSLSQGYHKLVEFFSFFACDQQLLWEKRMRPSFDLSTQKVE